tara:strand:+ start:1149 stop:1547 length:399 start_codon:yes stop_codon:yes gene_type:complete
MSAHHTHGINLPCDKPMQDDLNFAYHKSLGLDIMALIGTNPMLFSECKGFYDGVAEDSYIIHAHCLTEVMGLFALGKNFNQECILVVDHRTETVGLLYMDGQVSRIGHNLVQACDTVKGDYTQIGSKRYVVQ